MLAELSYLLLCKGQNWHFKNSSSSTNETVFTERCASIRAASFEQTLLWNARSRGSGKWENDWNGHW